MIEKYPKVEIGAMWIRKQVLDELKLHNPGWPERWYSYDKNAKKLHKYGY